MKLKYLFLNFIIFLMLLFVATGCSSKHEHVYEDTIISPTCTEKGYTIHTCKDNDDTFIDTYVDAIGHEYTDWIFIKDATCDESGAKMKQCTRCNDLVVEIVSAHNHNYIKTTIQATCVNEGYDLYTCSYCNASYRENIVEALGHDYEDVITNQTCTEKGYTTHTCRRCGESFVDTYTEALGHQWDEGEITTESTCLINGVKTYTCLVCGGQKNEVIDKTNHNYIEEILLAATCTTKGLKAIVCSECNYVEYEIIPMLEHYVVIDSEVLATCTDDGLTEGSHCLYCGKVFVEQEKIGKLGHDVVIDAKVDPTFDSAGLTEGTHCSRCNEILTKQEVIPKLEYTDYAYQIKFVFDSNVVSIETFKTQDMSLNGNYLDIGYSRDSETGELLKNGNGQINFIIHCNSDYVLDSISITGSYKNLKDSSDVGVDNGYRITKISSDLVVTIVAYKISSLQNSKMMLDFASYVKDDTAYYSWNTKLNLDHIDVLITYNNITKTSQLPGDVLDFHNTMNENTMYSLSFIPYYNNEILGEKILITSSYIPKVKEVSFNKIEIFTENNIIPTCDYISSPTGWGAGITNAEYVNSIVKFYNSSNELVYDSSITSSVNYYSGAKVKIRGNTSAYSAIKPYKIKLNKAVDLLKYYLGYDVSKDKEYVLLAQGQSLNYMIGRSVAKTVIDGDSWNPNYIYVSLYLNGDFIGMYILSECVNAKREGVSSTGYVIERDAYWWNEDLYFDSIDYYDNLAPLKYTFKYPDLLDENADEYAYIKKYVNSFENYLYSDDDKCLDYIDVTSFAKWLLIHDILSTYDSGGSNMFYYKDDNTSSTLLKMGPTWDFDSIFMSASAYGRVHTDTWSYFDKMFNFTVFKNEYKSAYNKYSSVIIANLSNEFVQCEDASYDQLIKYENIRWNSTFKTFGDQVNQANVFMSNHIDWMESQIN